MVGGWIIEILPLENGYSRLWCVDRGGDECAVVVQNQDVMPGLGDEIWWQAGRVYFDNDRRSLKKIANSFDPRRKENPDDQ